MEVSLLSSYLCTEGYRSANVETALLFRVQRFLWRLGRYMLGHFFNKFHFFLRIFLPFPRLDWEALEAHHAPGSGFLQCTSVLFFFFSSLCPYHLGGIMNIVQLSQP